MKEKELKKYVPPKYTIEKQMLFMYDFMKTDKANKMACRQCSSCHGCR
jgi:hypothetical protein